MRASPLEPDRSWPSAPGRLQDRHLPAPPGQGPRARRGRAARRPTTMQRRSSGTATIIGTARCARPRPRGGPAVRSAAVTSGMDVSTHPAHDTGPGAASSPTAPRRRRRPVAPMDPTSRTSPPAPDTGAARRVLRTVGFHLVALACFTVPAVVLWWHVWSGHPSSTLTCGCGDPAQEVWFMAWPAWAISHLHNLFFSGAVNVPARRQPALEHVGARWSASCWRRSRGSSVRSPPPTSRSTLAPALSAWGCFAAIRPLVTLEGGRHPGGAGLRLLVGHRHVARLRPRVGDGARDPAVPLHHAARDRDPPGALGPSRRARPGRAAGGAVPHLARDPGDVPAAGASSGCWRWWWSAGVSCGRAPGTPCPALGLAVGVTVVLLAYPAWYGLAGPQAVTGVLFALAPISGVPLSGLLAPGRVRGAAPTSTSASAATWVATGRRPTTSAGAWRWPRWARRRRPPPPAHLAARPPGGA